MAYNTKKRSDTPNRARRSNQKQDSRNASGQRRRPRGGSRSNSRWGHNRLSDHFTKTNFDSRKKGCDCFNSLRISLGLVGILEALRTKVSKRIDIITGYYCPECRPRQYGVKRDFHHQGLAADIRIDGMSLVDLFLMAETFPEIKGLGINFDDGHVHVDTRKTPERDTWVEQSGQWIPLTDDNRSEYIVTSTDDPQPTD